MTLEELLASGEPVSSHSPTPIPMPSSTGSDTTCQRWTFWVAVEGPPTSLPQNLFAPGNRECHLIGRWSTPGITLGLYLGQWQAPDNRQLPLDLK